MSNKYSIPVSLIQSLFSAPRIHKIDIESVLKRAGLSTLAPTLLSTAHTDERISLEDMGPLLRGLWHEMGDEASGFLRSPLKIGVFSMMCHSLITAGNLRRGLLRSARFISLLTDDIKLELEEIGDEARWVIHYTNPHHCDDVFFVTSLFVIWIRLSCWMINQPILLERIQFTFSQPDYEEEFSLMFPCRHYFSQSKNMVVFNKRFLALPLQQDAESLTVFLNHAPESLLTQFRSDDSLTAQINRMMLHRHGTHTELEALSFEAAAEELNMTTHTLRRRLKEEGNSFQEIKDSIRKDHAIVLLDRAELPLHEISEQLGFSEPAAFNRAFKKWTGVTPGLYRSNKLEKKS